MTARNVEGSNLFPLLHTRKLLRAGRNDEAASYLATHLSDHPQDHAAWHQLALAETQRRRYGRALGAIDRALALAPGNFAYRRFRGLALTHTGAFPEAIALLSAIIEARPDDYFALHALQIACCKSGDSARAIALGGRILEIEDRSVKAAADPPGADSAATGLSGRRRIIAFGLWGAEALYNYGALTNAKIARFIYPGWKCRFYLGADVPGGVRRLLREAGAEIVDASRGHAGVSPAMWRFLVADDPEVGTFMCRDCDARLSVKEAAAVDAWLRSGKAFHVMRDHVMHRNVMLAGMWGGKAQPRLHVARRLQRFLSGSVDARYGSDQRFLAGEIWPVIRGDCLVHDSYYALFGAQPFPVMGKGNDRFHVGMGLKGGSILEREAKALGLPWPMSRLMD